MFGPNPDGKSIINFFRSLNESDELDKAARERYTEALNRQHEAEALLKGKKQAADKAVIKLANRKRGIIGTSLFRFLEVYKQIRKIVFHEGDGMRELRSLVILPEEVASIKSVSLRIAEPLKDNEAKAFLIKRGIIDRYTGGLSYSGLANGIADAMVEESKRKMAAADDQMWVADVAYREAETIGTALDTVTERCNQIANLLASLNVLFVKSLHNITGIIERNGSSGDRYNSYERKCLMTCVNLAKTIKQIIDEPIIDKNGELAAETAKVLEIGNKFMREVEGI